MKLKIETRHVVALLSPSVYKITQISPPRCLFTGWPEWVGQVTCAIRASWSAIDRPANMHHRSTSLLSSQPRVTVQGGAHVLRFLTISETYPAPRPPRYPHTTAVKRTFPMDPLSTISQDMLNVYALITKAVSRATILWGAVWSSVGFRSPPRSGRSWAQALE